MECRKRSSIACSARPSDSTHCRSSGSSACAWRKVVGYLPQGGQTQRTSRYGASRHPDTSASYYIRQEFPADHPDRLAKKPWVFDNRWIEGLPGFRETELEYYEAMARLVPLVPPVQDDETGPAARFP